MDFSLYNQNRWFMQLWTKLIPTITCYYCVTSRLAWITNLFFLLAFFPLTFFYQISIRVCMVYLVFCNIWLGWKIRFLLFQFKLVFLQSCCCGYQIIEFLNSSYVFFGYVFYTMLQWSRCRFLVPDLNKIGFYYFQKFIYIFDKSNFWSNRYHPFYFRYFPPEKT